MSFDAAMLLRLLPAVYGLRDRAAAAVSPGWLSRPDRIEFARLQALSDAGILPVADKSTLERLRDRALAGPLASLLAVIAEQITVIEEDLDQLYDDQFVETAAEWAIPYIGDLIGYRSLHNIGNRSGRPRAEVAHTIGFRRRKGTLAVLEQLAFDVTGWPASAAEFFQRLITTQYVNHPRLHIAAAPDLRRWEPLERIGTAFDVIPRTVDVRRIASGRGRHNIPNVGLFVWRLGAYRLTGSPAARLDTRRYRFHPLGIDQPLFTDPETEAAPTKLSGPLNVPIPISRRVLRERFGDYYGDIDSLRSLRVWLDRGAGLELVVAARGPGDPADRPELRICHLGDLAGGWAHMPAAGAAVVAIDPVLGRIALPDAATDAWRVTVDFHYGFSADVGGGEYEREIRDEGPAPAIRRVPGDFPNITAALAGFDNGVVEVTGSGRYEETPAIGVAAGQQVELRAANGCRPTIVLGGRLMIAGGAGGKARLNGLLISGDAVTVPIGTGLASLEIVDCTLVPGLALGSDLTPDHPNSISLEIGVPDFSLTLTRTISGPVRAPKLARAEAIESIVDAIRPEGLAWAAPGGTAGAALSLRDCTVIGAIRAHKLPLVTNSILLARPDDLANPSIRSERRQDGCVRFTWLPPSSRTPRRYRCLPESAPSPDAAVPIFSSLRYGHPAYAQIAAASGPRLLSGADDESEPGVFHHLHGTWRDVNLRVRLDEYLRVGLEAGIIHES